MADALGDLRVFPPEIISAIGSQAGRKDLLAFRLASRTLNLLLEDSFINTCIHYRVHYFAPKILTKLHKLTGEPRFAKAIKHIRIVISNLEIGDAQQFSRSTLRSALDHISTAGGRVTLSATDRMPRAMREHWRLIERDDDIDDISITDTLINILEAADFPGTPVHSLDLGSDNEVFGLDEYQDRNVPCKSLSGLRCLKFGFSNMEGDRPRSYENEPYELEEVTAILNAAVDLQELSIASVDGCYFDADGHNRHLLKGLEKRVSRFNLRRLQLSGLYVRNEILEFAELFRDSLTHLSLHDVATSDRDAWPRLLRPVAAFPSLEHVIIHVLSYHAPELAVADETPEWMAFYCCTSANAGSPSLEITGNVTKALEDLACKVENGIFKTSVNAEGGEPPWPEVMPARAFPEWWSEADKRSQVTKAKRKYGGTPNFMGG